MYKKLNNAAWEQAINKFYSDYSELTIKDYCLDNNLNKSQFYYHRRRLNNKNDKDPVFHAVNLNDKTDIVKKEAPIPNNSLDITIMIGTATISIPVSETALINSIIKELL